MVYGDVYPLLDMRLLKKKTLGVKNIVKQYVEQAVLVNKNIKVMEDKELVSAKELSCELLISYDLPIKAIVYMARVAKATQKALGQLWYSP